MLMLSSEPVAIVTRAHAAYMIILLLLKSIVYRRFRLFYSASGLDMRYIHVIHTFIKHRVEKYQKLPSAPSTVVGLMHLLPLSLVHLLPLSLVYLLLLSEVHPLQLSVEHMLPT
jgi:hypothetical protein